MVADNTAPPPSDKTPVSGSNSAVICSSRARNVASPSSVKMSAIDFPVRSDNDGVDIAERDPEPFGEQCSHSALARAGGTDQDNRPFDRHRAQVRRIHGLGRT